MVIWAIALFVLPDIVLGQNQEFHVFDGNEKQILTLKENGQLTDSQNGSVYFTTKGNIVFKGASNDKRNIHLLLQSTDIFGSQPGKVFNGSMRKVLFMVAGGKFYLGDKIDQVNSNEIAYFNRDAEGFSVLKSSVDDRVLAMVTPGEISNIQLTAIFFQIYESQKLEVAVQEQQEENYQVAVDRNEGTIRPYWGSRLNNEWMWDGRTLKPKWGNRPEDEWLFDGESLKPYYQSNLDDEWLWDESTQNFKNAWRNGKRDEWMWEEGVLKPYWDADLKSHFVLEGNTVKPYWGHRPEQEWVIDGYLPLPIIALVVLGLADR